MDLKRPKDTWDTLARKDPLWAVLTDPRKKGGKWEEEEFFATGEHEIDGVLSHISSLGVELGKDMALDFGCGVGRLTQAMARYFEHCYGVDISPTMIELANKYNRYGDKCRYIVNDKEGLSLFEDDTFSFIYSSITLQHMEPRYSKQYIREFLRLLKPGGVLAFQLHSERVLRGAGKLKRLINSLVPRAILNFYLKLRYGAVIEMHYVPRSEVLELVRAYGARLLEPREGDATYYVTI